MADASGTTTWIYPANSALPSSVTHTPPEPGAATRTLAYTWDAQGRRLTTALDGTTLATYSYDPQGRMASVTPGTAGILPATFTYTYLNASTQVTNLVSVTYNPSSREGGLCLWFWASAGLPT